MNTPDPNLWPDGQPAWAAGDLAGRIIDIDKRGDEVWLTVLPLTFGRARLCVGAAPFIDEFW